MRIISCKNVLIEISQYVMPKNNNLTTLQENTSDVGIPQANINYEECEESKTLPLNVPVGFYYSP